jgi:RNA binding exosome subunit
MKENIKEFILLISFLIISLSISGQKKYALLVGISNYHSVDSETEWNNIHGVNDINLIEPVLDKQGFKIDKTIDSSATKANIIKHLRMLVSKVTKNSVVYIHFSTHGQPFEDQNGDESDGWDESIVPVDASIEYIKGKYEGNNHLLDDELNEITEQIRSKIGKNGHLYVVIDACHAGRASRDLEELSITRGTKRGFSPSGKTYRAKREVSTHYNLSSSPSKSPVTYLEACGNTQRNVEIKRNGTYYGPLSFYIAVILSSYNLHSDNGWVFKVKKMMSGDMNLINQNMVIETSE